MMPPVSARPLKRAGMIDLESNPTLVQQYPAHEAVPGGEGSPFPVVLVFHDVFGLDSQVRNTVNRLAHQGFYAVAPNFYASPFSTATGAPGWMSAAFQIAGNLDAIDLPIRTSFERRDAIAAEGRARNLADAHALEIVRSAITHCALVAEADSHSLGILGFGMGGRLAFLAACEFPEDVRAVAVYSPLGITANYHGKPGEPLPLARFESLRAPLLLFFGGQDTECRGERDAIQAVLTLSDKPHEIVTFREAGREFYADGSGDFRIAPARDSWGRTLAFLHGKLRPATPPDTPL